MACNFCGDENCIGHDQTPEDSEWCECDCTCGEEFCICECQCEFNEG